MGVGVALSKSIRFRGGLGNVGPEIDVPIYGVPTFAAVRLSDEGAGNGHLVELDDRRRMLRRLIK